MQAEPRVPWNKGKRLPPDPLLPEEARRLGCLHERSTLPNQVKINAIIVILWRCGLRCEEMCDLDLDDFHDGPGEGQFCTVRVLSPKGAARGAPPRELGLDRKGCNAIQRWVSLRGDWPGPLFSTRTGKRMQTSTIRKILPREAIAAKITRRVSPHAMRHTFALELYREGFGIIHIQKALGHTSLDMTSKYLTSIGATEVVALTAEREW